MKIPNIEKKISCMGRIIYRWVFSVVRLIKKNPALPVSKVSHFGLISFIEVMTLWVDGW